MKSVVFWDIKTQFAPHRRHIKSPLQSSAGSHDGDYEECRLLGYKILVRTSQETRYVSAIEQSQLMLCKI
jgi:hypothetical protein